MDPISRTRLQGRIDNAEEMKKPELVIPPARDWDKDGTNALEFARNAIPQETKVTIAARESNLNDTVLYLGMTSSAAGELAALRSTGATVIAVDHRASGEALGLSGKQAEDVAKIIAGNPELASIARVWAAAENGGQAPSRLVLSGHSTGSSVYGNGTVSFDKLLELAHAMPRAANHVEDIELSGCNTGINATADRERAKWMAAFPQLKTISGYQGACPMPGGADLVGWEHATRGRASSVALSSGQIAGDQATGNRAGKTDSWIMRLPLADLQARLHKADARFPDAFNGIGPELQPNAYDSKGLYSTLFEDYEMCKGACARNDLPAADIAKYEKMGGQLLRLRYWKDVTAKIAEKYNAPELRTIDRATVMRLASDPTQPHARELRALRDLDPTVIEESWCGHA